MNTSVNSRQPAPGPRAYRTGSLSRLGIRIAAAAVLALMAVGLSAGAAEAGGPTEDEKPPGATGGLMW